MHNNKKKMDHYSIPMTSTHKSEMLTILNESQSTDKGPLISIVSGVTDHMIMDTDQIDKFLVILHAATESYKQELINILDPNGPTPPIKL